MTRNKLLENIENQQVIDTSQWPTVLIDSLSEKDKETFLLRKKAVDMYFSNNSMQEIISETNIHRNLVSRLVKRCLEIDDKGLPYGYSALIPYKRVKKYSSENTNQGISRNYAGSFSQLLIRFPEIKEYIINQYFGKENGQITENNIKINTLHKKFLKKCRTLNIKETDYPFNTSDKGSRSLYRYIKHLKSLYYRDNTKRYGDDALKKFSSTGEGQQNNPIITRPFQQVQFDGHKIDAMISIKFKTIEGDIIIKPMSRIWLLVILDVATRVTLGHHLCLNSEYSSHDVLKCIENSVMPKQKMNLTIRNLKYPENGGYHSLCIPETKWALWDEFLYDNAKANLAKIVTEKLTQIVKCSINAGPVATPERRGLIERFFQTLEERGYHRLINTTGNSPNDPRRKNPEKHSVTYEITESEIEEITEILIANYNNTPHEGIYGFTPLDLMKQRIERGLVPRIMPEYEQNDTTFLSLKAVRKVSGDITKGRRPYITYEGVEYRNDTLSKMPDLIGQKLTLLVNINDLRVIKAYLADGSEFGMLTAKGKWSLKPHTLKMRQEINKLRNNKDINVNMYDDPIDIYHNYLVAKSTESKTSRNKLAILKKSQQTPSNDQMLKNEDSKSNNNHTETFSKKNTNKNNLTTYDTQKIDELKNSKIFKTLNFD